MELEETSSFWCYLETSQGHVPLGRPGQAVGAELSSASLQVVTLAVMSSLPQPSPGLWQHMEWSVCFEAGLLNWKVHHSQYIIEHIVLELILGLPHRTWPHTLQSQMAGR